MKLPAVGALNFHLATCDACNWHW